MKALIKWFKRWLTDPECIEAWAHFIPFGFHYPSIMHAPREIEQGSGEGNADD